MTIQNVSTSDSGTYICSVSTKVPIDLKYDVEVLESRNDFRASTYKGYSSSTYYWWIKCEFFSGHSDQQVDIRCVHIFHWHSFAGLIIAFTTASVLMTFFGVLSAASTTISTAEPNEKGFFFIFLNRLNLEKVSELSFFSRPKTKSENFKFTQSGISEFR